MIIRRVHATNFRSWRELDLELPEGVAAITGQNGAGKTSILSAIDTCLFGGNLRDQLTAGETSTRLEVEIGHGDVEYKVCRAYTSKGGGKTSLDLYQSGMGWIPLTAESQKATQDRIEQILGLNRDTWRASAYLAQRDGSFADPSVSPRDRKRLLADALGLDQWDTILQWARTDKAQAEHDAMILAGRRATLRDTAAGRDAAQADLDQARAERDEARMHAADFAAQLERATAAVEAAAAADAQRNAAQAAYDDATARERAAATRVAELTQRIDRIRTASGDREKLQQAAARVEELEEAHRQAVAAAAAADADARAYAAEHDRLSAEHSRARDAAIRATSAYDRLVAEQERYRAQITATREQPDEPCHTCGQPLPRDARERVIAGLETTLAGIRGDTEHRLRERDAADEMARDAADQLAKLVEPAKPNPRDRSDAEQAAAKARAAATGLAALDAAEAQLADLEHQVEVERETERLARAAAAAAQAALDAAPTGAVDEARAARARLQALLEGAQNAVTAAEQRIGAADARLAQTISAAGALQGADAEAERLDAQLAVLTECCQAFGPNGIPAMILETSAIPQIEAEADRILAELGTSYRVELRTQRAKRSSDGVIETLDVVIITPDGERSFEHFSGGEMTRINLALRLALSQLLASRRGADVRVFLVDEPEGLDAAGMEAFARILRGLATSFESILVVSHHSDLRDSFDQVLDVARNDAGESTLGGVLDAVRG